MKILNYGITYGDKDGNHDIIIVSKMALVRLYLELLDTRRDIWSLAAYQWQGVKNPTKKDITNDLNMFLSR